MNEEPRRSEGLGDEAAAERAEPFGRPLPDGGLAEAMPEWLRRPPAWRRSTEPRALDLPPDTSPIDPRTLVEVEDLPPWLQRFARRAERDSAEPMGDAPDRPAGEEKANARPRTEPVVDPHRARQGAWPREIDAPESAVKVGTTLGPDEGAAEAGGSAPPRQAGTDEPQPPRELVEAGDRPVPWILVGLITLAVLAVVGIAVLVFVL